MAKTEKAANLAKEAATAAPVAAPAPVADPAAAPAEGAAPAAAKKAGGGNAIIIEVNGQKVKRADYIREQFAAGRKRGEIAKELNVPYQIVFAATKTVAAPAAPAAAAAAAPAPEASQAAA